MVVPDADTLFNSIITISHVFIEMKPPVLQFPNERLDNDEDPGEEEPDIFMLKFDEINLSEKVEPPQGNRPYYGI